jgi:hypothetical protein
MMAEAKKGSSGITSRAKSEIKGGEKREMERSRKSIKSVSYHFIVALGGHRDTLLRDI